MFIDDVTAEISSKMKFWSIKELYNLFRSSQMLQNGYSTIQMDNDPKHTATATQKAKKCNVYLTATQMSMLLNYKGIKTHKQAPTEVGSNVGLAKHLKGRKVSIW